MARNRAAGASARFELRFILPNLITVLAICAGLTGIRFAFEGRIAEAGRPWCCSLPFSMALTGGWRAR